MVFFDFSWLYSRTRHLLFSDCVEVPMADLPTRRRALVQELRRLAIQHGVARVPDNANRQKVQQMAQALLNSHALDPAARAAAQQT